MTRPEQEWQEPATAGPRWSTVLRSLVLGTALLAALGALVVLVVVAWVSVRSLV